MRIKLPKATQVGIGGGISFISNFRKAITPFGHQIVNDGEDYDLLFISGATLCDRETFVHAKENGKKIILRVDNILEDSKNRNTGMPRMEEFAKDCDLVVYQSEWAKKLLTPHCGEGMIIYNGIDTDIFHPSEKEKDWEGIRIFYSKYGRGEGKNFNVVQYFFREYCLSNDNATLVLAGRFADEIQKINHPFEFHHDEDFQYLGVVSDPNRLAEIMQSCDVALLPYFSDACSNTVLEAQACGLPVIYDHSGGTPEIVEYGEMLDGRLPRDLQVQIAMTTKGRFIFEEWKEKWGLEKMGREYHKVFEILSRGQQDRIEE
jgi:glycosyltransferase involved in cell wall biosynthesis